MVNFKLNKRESLLASPFIYLSKHFFEDHCLLMESGFFICRPGCDFSWWCSREFHSGGAMPST